MLATVVCSILTHKHPVVVEKHLVFTKNAIHYCMYCIVKSDTVHSLSLIQLLILFTDILENIEIYLESFKPESETNPDPEY